MITFNNLGNLGRLANQMFQYASLKGIATNKGFDFFIPPEENFGTTDPLVRDDPLNIHKCFNIGEKVQIGMYPTHMLPERMHTFDRELFDNCPDNIDLFGYYQSPKYFQHIEDDIRKDFAFTKELNDTCDDVISTLKSDDVISLHIRRTDYVANPNHPLRYLHPCHHQSLLDRRLSFSSPLQEYFLRNQALLSSSLGMKFQCALRHPSSSSCFPFFSCSFWLVSLPL